MMMTLANDRKKTHRQCRLGFILEESILNATSGPHIYASSKVIADYIQIIYDLQTSDLQNIWVGISINSCLIILQDNS